MKKNRPTTIYIRLVIILLPILLYALLPSVRNFIDESIKQIANGDIEGIKNYLLSYGFWSPFVSTILMIIAVIIAPLPTFVITFANGLLFGTFLGGLLSWISALFGAIAAFYISRSLGKPVVEKVVNKKILTWMSNFFKSYGIHAIILARIVPIASYGMVSFAAGLTTMRFRTYIIGTAIGQTPATILFSYLGEHATDSVWILFVVFLVVFAMVVIGSILKPRFERSWKKK